MTRDNAIELTTIFIYGDAATRREIECVGWDNESDSVKDEWRTDVRNTIEAYEKFLGLI